MEGPALFGRNALFVEVGRGLPGSVAERKGGVVFVDVDAFPCFHDLKGDGAGGVRFGIRNVEYTGADRRGGDGQDPRHLVGVGGAFPEVQNADVVFAFVPDLLREDHGFRAAGTDCRKGQLRRGSQGDDDGVRRGEFRERLHASEGKIVPGVVFVDVCGDLSGVERLHGYGAAEDLHADQGAVGVACRKDFVGYGDRTADELSVTHAEVGVGIALVIRAVQVENAVFKVVLRFLRAQEIAEKPLGTDFQRIVPDVKRHIPGIALRVGAVRIGELNVDILRIRRPLVRRDEAHVQNGALPVFGDAAALDAQFMHAEIGLLLHREEIEGLGVALFSVFPESENEDIVFPQIACQRDRITAELHGLTGDDVLRHQPSRDLLFSHAEGRGDGLAGAAAEGCGARVHSLDGREELRARLEVLVTEVDRAAAEGVRAFPEADGVGAVCDLHAVFVVLRYDRIILFAVVRVARRGHLPRGAARDDHQFAVCAGQSLKTREIEGPGVAQLIFEGGRVVCGESGHGFAAVQLLEIRPAQTVEVGRLRGGVVPLVADRCLIGVHIVHREHHAAAPDVQFGIVGGDVQGAVHGTLGIAHVHRVEVVFRVRFDVRVHLSRRAFRDQLAVGVFMEGRREERVDETAGSAGRDGFQHILRDDIGGAVHLEEQEKLFSDRLGLQFAEGFPAGQHFRVEFCREEGQIREIRVVVIADAPALAVYAVRAFVLIEVAELADQDGGAPNRLSVFNGEGTEVEPVDRDHVVIGVDRLLRGVGRVPAAVLAPGEFHVGERLAVFLTHGDRCRHPFAVRVPNRQIQSGLNAHHIQGALAGGFQIVGDAGVDVLAVLIRPVLLVSRTVVRGKGASVEDHRTVAGGGGKEYAVGGIVVADGQRFGEAVGAACKGRRLDHGVLRGDPGALLNVGHPAVRSPGIHGLRRVADPRRADREAAVFVLFRPDVEVQVAGGHALIVKDDVFHIACRVRRVHETVFAPAVRQFAHDEHHGVLGFRPVPGERVDEEVALPCPDGLVTAAFGDVLRQIRGVPGETVCGDLEGYGRIRRVVGLSGQFVRRVVCGRVDHLLGGGILSQTRRHPLFLRV